jgi:glutamate-1-semialdehyde 2,1-aminomutase
MGKSIAGGVPLGVYGMTEPLARQMEAQREVERWPAGSSGSLVVGGTLYGNPLSLAAARAALSEILTPEGHARTAELGGLLADGIERIVRDAGLPWSAHRLYCRTGVCYAEDAPRNAIDASRAANFELNRLHRIFLANRGVWEAVLSAGPTVSFAAQREDVAKYLAVFDELIAVLVD